MAHTQATLPTQASPATQEVPLAAAPHLLDIQVDPLLAIPHLQGMVRRPVTILLSREVTKDMDTKAHLVEDIILHGTWDRRVDLVDRPGLEGLEDIPRTTPATDPRLVQEGLLSP